MAHLPIPNSNSNVNARHHHRRNRPDSEEDEDLNRLRGLDGADKDTLNNLAKLLSGISDQDTTNKAIKNEPLHDLFSGPLVTIKMLFVKIYKSKSALQKLELEISKINSTRNIDTCVKEIHWFTQLRPMQFGHPIVDECTAANQQMLTIAMNQIAATVYAEAYNKQCELYLSDIKSIVAATCLNFDVWAHNKSKIYGRTELAQWLPQEHLGAVASHLTDEQVDPEAISARSLHQRVLFTKAIQDYRMLLEQRFSSLSFADHIDTTLSARWIDRGMTKTLKRIKSKTKKQREFNTKRFEDAAQVELVKDRLRKLYLDYNSTVITLSPSCALIRARRQLVKSHMTPSIKNLKSITFNELKMHVLALTKDQSGFKGLAKLFDITTIDAVNFKQIIESDKNILQRYKTVSTADLAKIQAVHYVDASAAEAAAANDLEEKKQGLDEAAETRARMEHQRLKALKIIDVRCAGFVNGDPANADDNRHSLLSHFKFYKAK